MQDSRNWQLTNLPSDRLQATWKSGRFETARRARTSEVEGRIVSDHHLVMVTLNGGADRHVFRTDDGFRYDGRDRKGMVSFLPAGCSRDLSLRNVAWEWAAIAIDPDSERSDGRRLDALSPFLLPQDDFVYAMMSRMSELLNRDGSLDATYASAMTLAMTEHLSLRASPSKITPPKYALTPRQLRETEARIDAGLAGSLTIGDLSAPLGISEGHFFRAFRGSTGETPLQAISKRRMQRARQLLEDTDLDMIAIAAECGIASPGHFARQFRADCGLSPSAWRQQHGRRRVTSPAY